MKDLGGRRRRSSATRGGAAVHFERLFIEHRVPIARYAQRRVADDAVADVVAEVFTIAWRRLGDIREPELPWLYQVAHHVIANSNRLRRREAAFFRDPASALVGLSEDDPAAVATSRLAAAAAFAQLGDSDREMLGLVAWEGLDLRELAATLGISTGAATVRLHRARNRLQVALARCSDLRPMSLEAAND